MLLLSMRRLQHSVLRRLRARAAGARGGAATAAVRRLVRELPGAGLGRRADAAAGRIAKDVTEGGGLANPAGSDLA